MIEKINDNAYFIIDLNSFYSSIQRYDSVLANQTIMSEAETEPDYTLIIEEPEEKTAKS